MSRRLRSLSIYFPAYYDENTIEALVREGVTVGRELADDVEVIVVDDHSPDRVGEIADRLAKEIKEVRVIHHPVNRGVGAAMVTGYTQATKEYVFYTDGDAQYDLKELKNLVEYTASYDAVIGYRLTRAEGWFRIFASKVFHLLMFLTFGLRYRDIDASFKLISRKVLNNIRFRTSGGLVDSELLIQIKKFGFSVKEVGVHHYPRRFGHSLCMRPKMVFNMLCDILRLRMSYWFTP